MLAARLGYLHPLTDGISLHAGAGFGTLEYGYLFDNPAGTLAVFTPEVGLLFGPDRAFGRILVGVAGVVPLGRVSGEQQISPPHVMGTVVLSF